MKKSIVLMCLCVPILLSAPALAAQGQWTEGYGQGVAEYFADQGDVRLYIACPTDGDPDTPSSVTAVSVKTSRQLGRFTVEVGGASFEGPFAADSRAGDSNFLSLVERLRKGDAVVKIGGQAIKFPKSNAAKVLPVYGKKSWACNLSM